MAAEFPVKTKVAADLLNTNVGNLLSALRRKKIPVTLKRDSSGDYLWFEADLEVARKSLATDKRRKQPIEA
jgi:hypothetical protein